MLHAEAVGQLGSPMGAGGGDVHVPDWQVEPVEHWVGSVDGRAGEPNEGTYDVATCTAVLCIGLEVLARS
jgi:hypothetical protein